MLSISIYLSLTLYSKKRIYIIELTVAKPFFKCEHFQICCIMFVRCFKKWPNWGKQKNVCRIDVLTQCPIFVTIRDTWVWLFSVGFFMWISMFFIDFLTIVFQLLIEKFIDTKFFLCSQLNRWLKIWINGPNRNM